MGDAQVLPNGNILVTFSRSGTIHEVTSSGQLVGYTEHRDSLYGPPPRWRAYALSRSRDR